MRALRPIVVTLGLAATVLAGSAGGASAASFPADGLGFNVPAPLQVPQSEADTIRELDAAQRAGLTRVRFPLSWKALEPSGPGRIDPGRLATLDRFVDLALARGIEPLPILLFTPDWARGISALDTAPPTDAADLGRFAGRMAAHFGKRFDAFEVWNEPNMATFWGGGQADPARYTQLLRAVYPAVKAANPAASVIAAAASPAADGLLSTSAVTFYRGIYRAGGKGFFDAAAAHPYTWGGVDAWNTDVDGLHRLMSENGDGDKKVWITEDGIPTAATSPGVTESAQRDYLLEALDLANSRPWAGPMTLYSLRDTGAASDPYATFGLLRGDFSPKASYAALLAIKPAQASAPVPTTCRGTRRVSVTLKRLRGGDRYVRVAVKVGSRKQQVTKGRRLRRARVDLRGLGPRTYRVRITARTAAGRTVRISRTYRGCVVPTR